MSQFSVIIPIYNEESVVKDTIDSVKACADKITGFDYEILCINDGSTDNTPEVLKNYPGIRVIHHQVNRGYGAALKTGLDSCKSEWVFIVDADGTYPIEQLPQLVEKITPEVTMVVGSREGPGISKFPLKRLARWILRKMVHTVTGVMVPDLNSGMRIFKHSLYREFRHLLPMGFSFTSTITVACLYRGYHLIYTPIHYAKRVGDSSIRPIRDFFGFSILIIRLATYFEPLKFFLPISMAVVVLALVRALRDVFLVNSIGSLAVILMFFALQIFFVGILADLIVRRSVNNHERS